MCACRTHNLIITDESYCRRGKWTISNVNRERIPSLNVNEIYNDDILPCTTLNCTMWINHTIWFLIQIRSDSERVVCLLIRASIVLNGRKSQKKIVFNYQISSKCLLVKYRIFSQPKGLSTTTDMHTFINENMRTVCSMPNCGFQVNRRRSTMSIPHR